MINEILLSNNKAKGQRPYFFSDETVERVLTITMAVAGELAVTRERLDTLERLLQVKQVVTDDEIEYFIPTPEQAQKRQHWHADYIARILRIVQQELEAIQQPDENNRNMEEILEELGRS
ncbi:hypothetical protein [Spirosoma endbachense]|uniref:Uncharacterized protein n=1 Tax=Spirosoma endbachense TaxID=2666025 RepID=A0A6P1W5T0_9BACT|nr:hypothetical protein [Spirosoma endbachense]QHV99918.1 hypothetical protein GJR95_35070 [Spirosoma endbachense]